VSVIGKPIERPEPTGAVDLSELVRSGGYPYIKITVVEPEQGGVRIDTAGLPDDVDLAEAFRQLAELIDGGALEEVEA
jgi:hypothetical protein